jgi:ATP-dependent Lhr-like helicase
MPSVADLVRERFSDLTEIQKIAIPKVLSGENVIIIAPTGYGKTESALLPVLEKIQNEKSGICALYITPLRALSRDLLERFNWWCERLEISHDLRTGDTTTHERTKQRKDPPKILLTTVESMQALMLGKVMREHLKNVKFVIVDEIHDIMDNKRGVQLSLCLERLAQIATFSRVGISATIANEEEAAKLLFGTQSYSICEAGRNRKMDFSVEKFTKERLTQLIGNNRSLVFVNTRSTAEELCGSLKAGGINIEVHHGSLSKEVRQDAEDRFKSGHIKSLICTSSLELGIDIGDVNLVVQIGSPHQVFRLIQRVGRSGHQIGKLPKGIILSHDFDDELEANVVCTFAQNGYMEPKVVDRGSLDVIANQLVGLCIDFGRIKLSWAYSIFSKSYAFAISYDKFRKIALQLFSEGILFYDEEGEDVLVKATARARTYFVSFLSTIPKVKRFLMKDVSANRIISSLDEEFVLNLEIGATFFSKGTPWTVIDITEKEVLAQLGSSNEIIVPSWVGEDIPVPFDVAQAVGRMRRAKPSSPMPDEKTIILETIGDVIILHSCFGTKINEAVCRIFSKNLSQLVGESVRSVADPYCILVKLPFPLKEEQIKRCLVEVSNPRRTLEESVKESHLLKFKFLHVGRLFGLLSEDANVNIRFIDALRNSVVYEETIRSIFSRYFDVAGLEDFYSGLLSKKYSIVTDIRKKPSFYGEIALKRFSAGENVGAFEPRERLIAAFKENALSKAIKLKCLHCSAQRMMLLAGAPEKASELKCHKCNNSSIYIVGSNDEHKSDEDRSLSASLIRSHGKSALIALSTFGVGPKTAARILRKLHPDEGSFFMDLIEAQKLFIKNKKYWKL